MSRHIDITVTDSALAEIRKAAELLGMTVAAWVRMVALREARLVDGLAGRGA